MGVDPCLWGRSMLCRVQSTANGQEQSVANGSLRADCLTRFNLTNVARAISLPLLSNSMQTFGFPANHSGQCATEQNFRHTDCRFAK